MAVQPFYSPKFRAFDLNGDPLIGGLLYTYAAGTSTPLATYTTRAGNIANANPVVLDANGEADVWTTPGAEYKFELRSSAGVLQWTVDNVPSPTDSGQLIELPDGSVGSPGLTFVSDPDTGIYRVGTNDAALTAGGVKAFEWTSIGATLPLPTALSSTLSVTGLATLADGLVVSAPATSDRNGASITGNGTGVGVFGQGGSSGAYGGTFFGTANNAGVAGTGNGTGPGAVAIGGSTGNGVSALAGGTPTANTNDRWAVEAFSGHMHLSGGNPTYNTAFSNAITPTNISKANFRALTDGSGNIFIAQGFNIASYAISASTKIVLTLATAMASSAIVSVVGDFFGTWKVTTTSATNVTIEAKDSGGTDINWATSARIVHVVVHGAQ